MRAGDVLVRAMTAVSIISVSTAVLTLLVAVPVKRFLAPKEAARHGEKASQPSIVLYVRINQVAD
jgi:hypothetical protein